MITKRDLVGTLKENVVGGIGWAFGVTIGFAIVSTLIVLSLRRAGGIPVVGQFIATIVESTQAQLQTRTPTFINGGQ